MRKAALLLAIVAHITLVAQTYTGSVKNVNFYGGVTINI